MRMKFMPTRFDIFFLIQPYNKRTDKEAKKCVNIGKKENASE